jgi:hypothetical protein
MAPTRGVLSRCAGRLWSRWVWTSGRPPRRLLVGSSDSREHRRVPPWWNWNPAGVTVRSDDIGPKVPVSSALSLAVLASVKEPQ